MASTFTTNKVLEKPGNGDYVDTWNVPVNADLDVIDQAFGGVTSLNATAGSATLTSTQYRSLILSISGAMSANVTYTIPSGVGGQWIVRNTTTDGTGGPWTVTIASAGGGTSLTIDRNLNYTIFSDGTNIRRADEISVPNPFVSGTAMLFAQTTAPTGWTKSTTHNNKALRVVSGAASSGGTIPFTTAFTSQSVTGTVGNTTLTIDQIPPHNHEPIIAGGGNGATAFYSQAFGSTPYSAASRTTGWMSTQGGGQAHNHSFTGTSIDLTVQYVDVIIATKD